MLWQPPLPERYTSMSEAELAAAITARKAELGTDLIILGHHYQQDEVVQFADFTGDSFKLSQEAADRVKAAGAKYVIFCGVHFMAESADILTPDDVAVILPDLSAGCSMADMADYDQTVEAWNEIHEATEGTNTRVIPVTYMNSSAAIKSFVGEHGGAVCTSSNCHKVFQWALAGGDTPLAEGEQVKILFLPDQHLGRNTAAALGYDVQRDMALWDPRHADGFGGLDDETIQRATFLLWKGHCSVHKLFRPEHVQQIRDLWPDVTVMVHPECDHEVVKLADRTGSTEGIIQAIETAPKGSRWAIGTEVHLVNRLAKLAEQRGVTARILSDCQCLCTTMYRIDMPHLLWTMDNLVEGKVVNQIKVHPTVRQWSLRALDRMLTITGAAPLQVDAVAAG
ncbi:MAG: quinolinate synthase NadA [Phycisphaeraceae bacterium]